MKQSYNQAFLDKLREITEANLKDDQFGVSELAEKVGISRSTLYLRVNSLTNKSVSHFICETRLKAAFELLREGSLNISEVAYKVGFGSPTYFSKCFHDFYGFPPGEVGKRNFNSNPHHGLLTGRMSAFFSKHHLFLVASILVVMIIIATIIARPLISIHQESNKSIAVLPFKNLNQDTELQYFSEGVTENILNSLSYIKKLKIISGTSSGAYRETNKSLRQIAKELNASYILEGSVQVQNNYIKVIVQLNDAKKDRLIWSEIFNQELKDILSLQSEIAKQIAQELEIVLSPEEQKKIEKVYTESAEAYNLYLEGRFNYHLRTKEGFENSIRYYQNALKIDSNFCLAYAGLADSYLTGSWYDIFPPEKCIPKSRESAYKALSIQKKLPEAHATLGAIATYFDHNWQEAEYELRLALKLNPGYPRAYKLYSEYLEIIGQEEQARYYLNKAHEFNPTYVNIIWLSYLFYLRHGQYKEALHESNKIYNLNNFEEQYLWRNFFVHIHQDNMDQAIAEYQKLLSLIASEKEAQRLIQIYSISGKKAALAFIAKQEEKDIPLNYNYKRYKYYHIAIYHALSDEKEAALDYLEKAYQNGEKNIRMKTEMAFSKLKNEPRFIELLKKMKQSDQ